MAMFCFAALLISLSLSLSNCHAAFVPSLVRVPHVQSQRSSSLCSMVTESQSSSSSINPKSVTQPSQQQQQQPTTLITRLDQLASRCLDPQEHVILLASQCEDLFRQLQSDETTADTTACFNVHLKAWKNACATLAEHGHGHYHFSSNDQRMMIPSVPVYTARDAVERATNILLEMESSKEHADSSSSSSIRIVPDVTSYNIVIDAWAKSRVDDAPMACERLLKRMLDHADLEPDTASYNGVLESWANSQTDEGMERALKIWRHMEALYEQGNNNVRVKPTIRTVNTIIAAQAKRVRNLHGDEALEAARAAHGILKEMVEKYERTRDVDDQVDVMTYTSVMDAYGRCGSLEGAESAERLLMELKEASSTGSNPKLQPNVRTYTSLITAWAKTKSKKSPHRAEEVLLEMQAGGDVTKPNARSYTGVIQAWARSRDPTKPQRVLRLLKEMKERSKHGGEDVHPNLITYNTAIDACARCMGDTKQQTEALKIAFAILKSIQREPEMEPDQITYSTLMKATSFLLPAGDERNKVASALFEKARAAGMIDVLVMQNMRKAVDSNVTRELLAEMTNPQGHINYEQIPPAWSRNVR